MSLISGVQPVPILTVSVTTEVVYKELAILSSYVTLAFSSTLSPDTHTHTHKHIIFVIMFMLKSMLPLLLAVSLPFGSTAPANNAVPAARIFSLSDSADGTANITSFAVTTDPAVEVVAFDGTTCGGEGLVYERPDATCIGLDAGSLDIVQFFGNCRFSKFAYTQRLCYRAFLTQMNSESLEWF